jgi:cbb3-type cytochrome c oxidase subunit III
MVMSVVMGKGKWMKLLLVAGLGLSLVAFLSVSGPGTAAASDEAKNPVEGNADAIAKGAELFDTYCTYCHGDGALGATGPNLRDKTWLHGGSDAKVFESITRGRAEGSMPAVKYLKDGEVWSIIAYIRSLKK